MELIFNHRRPTWNDLITIKPSQNNNIIVDDTEPIAQPITQPITPEDEIDKQQKELINMSKEEDLTKNLKKQKKELKNMFKEDTRTQKKQKKEIKNMYKEDKKLQEENKKEQLKKFQEISLKIKNIEKKNFTRGNINNYFKKIIDINQEIDDLDEIVVNNNIVIQMISISLPFITDSNLMIIAGIIFKWILSICNGIIT